jgi:LysR family transcriptional regulator, low CO2-responsive transcriptional regulator
MDRPKGTGAMRSTYPHLSLQNLEILCAVAEFQSVSRAAGHVGIAQPGVTAHLRAIEHRLGVKLVTRVGRNVRLTEAGERVVRWASDLLTRTREIEREIGGLEGGGEGRVVVAASMTWGSYVLPDLIAAFRATHLRTSIATLVTNPRGTVEAVRSGACDFAISVMDKREDRANLVVELLWEEPLFLVSAPQSKLVGESVEASQLEDVPFVAAPKGLVFRDIEDEVLHANGIKRHNVPIEFGHPEAFKRLVRADVCLTFMFETSVREEIDRGDLRAVNIPGINIQIPISLIYRADKAFSPIQSELITHIRNSTPPGLRSLQDRNFFAISPAANSARHQ